MASSLKRPLIVYPLLLQFATLIASFAILLGVAIRLDSGGPYADERITPVIARAITRRGDGRLEIQMTEELAELRAGSPELWFMAEDDDGHGVSFGLVPQQFGSLRGALHGLSYAQLRDRLPPYDLSAVIRRERSPSGDLTILGHGRLTELSLLVVLASNVIVLPIFLLLTITSLLVTPWIVRRSLSGLARIVQEAGQIDTGRRGLRLSEGKAPREIAPLVRAMNDALQRLDEGYERHRRFIASAAHELRTPVAVIRAKLEAAPSSPMRNLAHDVQRLAILTEQLLDLERMEADVGADEVDLSTAIREVVADLAPLLISAGRNIELELERGGRFLGHAPAIQRAAMNLIQNAVEHGGLNVTVRVRGTMFEVEDDGPGIPPEERERVFEAFYRLRPRSNGSGLGLNLVREVVERHGGHVMIDAADGGGTIVRVELPDTRVEPSAA